ncbi:MAG: DUF4126 domain-containing protein [Alphaproteobacteria bacterium]|nr:DUF4126 domain-containing protein [Alphaproteobacteria bacterium]MBU1514031.1 DUF4126 domain-containing protein [Alphaproteobacteria bacterium]MBU2093029.1 DUF4126 domain-containing protein [Alphaproteobacteria bacterium]MBU2151768.1 DUF4126 domain-containing protein [Alphaproteobacteria bacterium]MBU2309412.1 DUF4126 domain-containing protein [Alphaproteobacteria bacterium]
MTFYLAALLLGVIAGLRAVTPVAAVSWAASLGILKLTGTPLAFLGATITPWIVTLIAAGELLNDKLPKTPSRKVPIQFGGRIATGGLSGAAVGLSTGALIPGLVLGVIGAVIGTYGGAAARGKLAGVFGRDLPAALIEDLVAVGGAALIVAYFL